MTTILIKDTLRQSVEAASDGVQTVLYTPKGQPTFMTVIPQKKLSELYPTTFSGDNRIHPSFLINGKKAGEILLGTYQGNIINGELVSQPYKPRAQQNNYNNSWAAVRALGAGHHASTWSERALINGLCIGANYNPYGDNQYGSSLIGHGIRIDGKKPGDTSSTSDVYGGSGPVAYRHDNKFTGLCDVSLGYADLSTTGGGLHPAHHGIRVFDCEIQVLVDNNAATITDIMFYAPTNRSAEWRAIDGTTGNLIIPTFTTNTDGSVTATTKDSVRVVELDRMPSTQSGKSAVMPANSFGCMGPWWNFSTGIFSHNLSDAALATLQILSLYPVQEISTLKGNAQIGTCNFYDLKGKVMTATKYTGYASVFGFAFTGANTLPGSYSIVRPAWYNPATLS